MNLANDRTKPRTCANSHLNNPPKPVLVPKSCCYCSKVFVNSSYLLKHLLRRHSENFMAVHRKCLTHEATEAKITRCIQSEFTALRKELALTNANSQECGPFHNHATKATQCSYSQDLHTIEKENKITAPGSKVFCQRNKDDSFPDENQVGVRYVELGKEVKVLSEKLNIIEREILMKRDLCDLLTANEKKVLQVQEEKLMQYKSDVLNEMNSVLQKAVNKVNSDGENQYVRLKQHISKITSDIDQIKQCMIFADEKKEEFEKKLEEKIIRFLDTSSMKKKKQKGSKSQCDDILVSGDFARPNSSISLINNVVPKVSSELEFNLLANSSGFISNRKDRNKSQEAFHDPRNQTFFSDCYNDEISAIVSAEMQSLEIPPGTTRLSYREFLEKKNKLHVKYAHWSQQKSFAQTYNKLNKFAQRKTEKRFHKKNVRVTFDVPSRGQDSFLPLKACNAEGFHSTPLSKKPVRNYENSHVTLAALESSLLNPNLEINPKDASLGFSDFRISSKSLDALESKLSTSNHEINPKDESQGFSDIRIWSKSQKFNLGQSSQIFSKQFSPVMSKEFNFPPKMEDLVNNGNPGSEKSPEQNSDICLSDASSLESWSSEDQKDN